MKQILFVISLVSVSLGWSQTTITGTVTNQNKKPVKNALVFIADSPDVTKTDAEGKYSLFTFATGEQAIGVKKESVEVQTFKVVLTPGNLEKSLTVEEAKQIEEIVISAGSIKASNDRAVAILDPIDIVTTAGGQGDIAGAIQTLPGVQRNGGDMTGLMVRGGDVNEAAVLVDGLVAQNAFGSTVPGVSQRTRFNPFQFKGTSFATGGYSARFGQALSAVLDLSTNDIPEKSNLNLGANFAGLYASGEKVMEKSVVEFTGSYLNLSPFLLVAEPNVDFYEAPNGFNMSARYVARPSKLGMFKTTFTQSFNSSGLNLVNPADASQSLKFGIKNKNTYLNTSYKDKMGKNWMGFAAISMSNNVDNIEWGDFAVFRQDERVQARGEATWSPVNRFRMVTGVELQNYAYTQQFDTLLGRFEELNSAGYVEADILAAKWLAVKPGVRAEYSQILAKGNIAPRFAAAIKMNSKAQFSLASGLFYQSAAPNYLLLGYRPDFQQSAHYMANFQYMTPERVFRVEGYYKSYNQLVRENGVAYTPNQFRFNMGQVDNSGYGYAQGIDFFWRDKKLAENLDYWISYSYIDTKRLYQNYVTEVTPDYVSDHNLNVVMKYFWMKAQTNFSATYSYASGRAYYNPNNPVFFGDRAPAYHNVAVTISYLATIKKFFSVFYLSVDNVLNQKNILGYRYSLDGTQSYAIKPPFYFNVFFGFNLSLQEFNKDEL